MKVNQVISSIDKNSGGTATYVQGLSKALSKNINLKIYTGKSKLKLEFRSAKKWKDNTNHRI